MIFPYLSTTPLEIGAPCAPFREITGWQVDSCSMGRYPSAVLAEPPFGGSIIVPSPHHRHIRGSAPRLRFARCALVALHRLRVHRKLRADPNRE